jgi:hypothetical protein
MARLANPSSAGTDDGAAGVTIDCTFGDDESFGRLLRRSDSAMSVSAVCRCPGSSAAATNVVLKSRTAASHASSVMFEFHLKSDT